MTLITPKPTPNYAQKFEKNKKPSAGGKHSTVQRARVNKNSHYPISQIFGLSERFGSQFLAVISDQ